jgi:hypothetical protein
MRDKYAELILELAKSKIHDYHEGKIILYSGKLTGIDSMRPENVTDSLDIDGYEYIFVAKDRQSLDRMMRRVFESHRLYSQQEESVIVYSDGNDGFWGNGLEGLIFYMN